MKTSKKSFVFSPHVFAIQRILPEVQAVNEIFILRDRLRVNEHKILAGTADWIVFVSCVAM